MYVCRIAAAVAMADYVQGVRWNAATTRDAVDMGLYEVGCHYFKGKGFLIAAVLTLVAGVLGIRSFIMIQLRPSPSTTTASSLLLLQLLLRVKHMHRCRYDDLTRADTRVARPGVHSFVPTAAMLIPVGDYIWRLNFVYLYVSTVPLNLYVIACVQKE